MRGGVPLFSIITAEGSSTFRRQFLKVIFYVAIVLIGISFTPTLYIHYVDYRAQYSAHLPAQFPVTVNPRTKTIVENDQVNELFENPNSPLRASAAGGESAFNKLFALIASGIADLPLYRSLASARNRIVVVTPGMRKEQVAAVFGNELGWNAVERTRFQTAIAGTELPLLEGSFSPGTYVLDADATPLEAQALVNERFSSEILTRYSTSTARIIPLQQALTIASLIEREAGGYDDMRLISGIIWNRLFLNMNLQVDATLQYAKANTTTGGGWWPKIGPTDRSRSSAYNTYLHPGLPPSPIANPSIATVLAALNPKNTPCLYYFHDAQGGFHCSRTYTEHVALLKKYYGQGR